MVNDKAVKLGTTDVFKLPRTHVIPVGFRFVSSDPLDIGSEALVEPQVVPPLHSYEITEPLVSQLVCNHRVNPRFVVVRVLLRVVEERCFSVQDQTPVLHGTGTEVRYCY